MNTIKMCWCGLCLAINNNHDTDCGDGGDCDNDEECVGNLKCSDGTGMDH